MVDYEIGTQIPKGVIMAWYGTYETIPTGWAFCNGSNGTPDLRNKFVVGGSNVTGAATSTVAGGPSQTGGSSAHSHGVTVILGVDTDILEDFELGSYSSTATGSTTTEYNVPPFKALFYIMKL